MAVVLAARDLTDAQRDTAMYWRDNPDGVTGLPAGHWMQIAAGQAAHRNLVGAAELLALVGATIADAFTSCWVEKYRTNLLRPVTYIRRVIEPDWNSFVNSPAFPEYTSGHSVGSAAAAHALTHLVGEIGFVDHGAATRGYVPRPFRSFRAAADEAAQSRLLGGIHYPMAIEVGLQQGVHVATTVLHHLQTRHPR